MTLGARIRYFRNLRGMNQKQLGLLLGFPDSNADVRIAQYECNSRSPKKDRLKDFAAALHISPLALSVPAINDENELMHLLFSLEDEFGLKIGCADEKVFLIFDNSADKTFSCFSDMLLEWFSRSQAYCHGIISREEYDEWRYSYHKNSADCARKKYRIKGLKRNRLH